MAEARCPSDIVFHGAQADCPFCLAVALRLPPAGSRIIILSGYDCGRVAEVVELDERDDDALLCRFEGDSPEVLIRENRRSTAFVDQVAFTVPDWAPPTSIEDAYGIHESMIGAFVHAICTGEPRPLGPVLRAVVAAVWHHRLPVFADDIWPMLLAHGWPPEAGGLTKDRYTFGLDLLRDAVGRKAIARKRMSPFSAGRYVPHKRS